MAKQLLASLASRSAEWTISILLLSFGFMAIEPAAAQVPSAVSNPRGDNLAVPTERNQPIPEQTNPQTLEKGAASKGLWERGNLLDDMAGLRSVLDDHGIALGLTETSEVLGNPTGGRAQGAVYEGMTEISLGIDLERAIGLPDSILNVSVLQIHGRGLSANNVDNLNVVSSIEADRATRLFELWYQLSLFDGRVDVKIGQQSADLEFITTLYGGLFVNSSFGWPTLPAVDLPSSGSAYPLATAGVRLRGRPTEASTILFGVFNGSPAGVETGDPQIRNGSGMTLNMNNGVFIVGEVQYASNQGAEAAWLPGTYKVGASYNSNAFSNRVFMASPEMATDSCANPSAARCSNWSLYAVLDQLVYHPPSVKEEGAGIFGRVIGAPDDRNQINLFVDGGVTYKGAFGRANDTMGLGIGWSRVSNTASVGDAAFAASTGQFYPTRTGEVVLEASYQVQIAPWGTLQPDLQYVFNPGGGILNPNLPTKRLGDATIFGLRTSITF
jgi:porin